MDIVELKERDTLSVRYRTPVSKLPESMGPVYGEIAACAAAQGAAFAGPPFALYYNMDMDDLDVEIGFPVARPAKAAGRVKPGRLPGGRTASAVHVGAYGSIGATYEKLTAFVGEKGLTPEEFMYEEYLNDPLEVPPEQLVTAIYFPLKA